MAENSNFYTLYKFYAVEFSSFVKYAVADPDLELRGAGGGGGGV